MDSSIASTEYQYHQLEQDHLDKFDILAGMKHDFRTPLTHILGFSALMQSSSADSAHDPRTQKFLQKIAVSGDALLQTLNSLLELSDVESKRQVAQDSEICDLVEIANKAVNLEHLHSEKTGVAVSLDMPQEMNVVLVRSATETLISAMLHAATSATPRGNSVQIRTIQLDDEVQISVRSDMGSFYLEDVPHRLAHHLKDLKSNSGVLGNRAETSTPVTLRLSLVDTLVRALGGQFSMSQHDSKGFYLAVKLPVGVDLQTSAELKQAA